MSRFDSKNPPVQKFFVYDFSMGEIDVHKKMVFLRILRRLLIFWSNQFFDKIHRNITNLRVFQLKLG